MFEYITVLIIKISQFNASNASIVKHFTILPDNTILNWSDLKAFACNKSNISQKVGFIFEKDTEH